MITFLIGRVWPDNRPVFSILVFLCFAATLLAWGYGPLTTQAVLEKQVQSMKVQLHELELDQVQKDSRIALLEHEINGLERHRQRLVADVISYTRDHTPPKALGTPCTERGQ